MMELLVVLCASCSGGVSVQQELVFFLLKFTSTCKDLWVCFLHGGFLEVFLEFFNMFVIFLRAYVVLADLWSVYVELFWNFGFFLPWFWVFMLRFPWGADVFPEEIFSWQQLEEEEKQAGGCGEEEQKHDCNCMKFLVS